MRGIYLVLRDIGGGVERVRGREVEYWCRVSGSGGEIGKYRL